MVNCIYCREINGRDSVISTDSKVHGANMGPTWGWQDPGGPHVGPMNLAVWEPIPRHATATHGKILAIHIKVATNFLVTFCHWFSYNITNTTTPTNIKQHWTCLSFLWNRISQIKPTSCKIQFIRSYISPFCNESDAEILCKTYSPWKHYIL